MSFLTKPLAPWLWPAVFLILGLVAVATLANITTTWLEQRQQAQKVDVLTGKLGVATLELQTKTSALNAERKTTEKLQQALMDERAAQRKTEAKRQALNDAFVELKGEMEALENAEPDVKLWADTDVPVAVQRLHQQARDRYRGKDDGAKDIATGKSAAPVPHPGSDHTIVEKP